MVEPTGRRPLKSRGLQIFQQLAAWLANTSISPNMISVSSVVFALAAGAAMAATSQMTGSLAVRLTWFVAAMLIQLRLIANLLDGMVAVEGGKASAVGELYNEFPDRIADSLILIGAGLAAGTLELGLAASLVAVMVAYVRALGASVGAGQTFYGPMAKPQRMALMTVVSLWMSLAPFAWQWQPSDSGMGIVGAALIIVVVGGLITVVRRLVKIADTMKNAAEGN